MPESAILLPIYTSKDKRACEDANGVCPHALDEDDCLLFGNIVDYTRREQCIEAEQEALKARKGKTNA